ncbi:MAG: glycoside hydrolase family 2 protein, partial [Ruminococcus flavefaciens]|nr:glycoside hydrolase family 2 protein [Ruminococcus flavefaciens]
MRTTISWNDGWHFAKTAEIPASLPRGWEAVTLPHTWNAVDGQDGGNDYWRGTAAYCKQFDRPELPQGGRVILEFQGAAMTAEVYLNGQKLASHEGGYSTFRVDLTDALAEQNLLCVTVDNSENDRVYPQKADFTFYGGLYRDVNLIIVPNTHFELCKDGTPGIKVTPIMSEDLKTAQVAVETWQNGGSVTIRVNGESQTVPSVDGHAQAAFTIENVHLWDGVDDPYLYTATAVLDSGDEISARFGCRRFAVDPEKGFLLNGREYPLRGVSRHQDRAGLGNALTIKEHQEDMELIREIGANTIRLAHYQHAQEFYDLCDEYGMIVWAEIPYITLHMPNGRQNTLDQMRELVVQCYNHPSIVCWGLSNEITASGQVTEDLMDNHRQLNDLCHRLDATRPTTMAHAFMLEQDSPLIPIADLASYNLYFGWYLGELEQNGSFFDEYHERYPDRPMGFSEYGADANPQFQDASPEKGDYTESYQCIYHEHILKCIDQRPWMWATHVWNMFDFAADGRDEGGKHGVNQKGLVTMDRKLKKDAFYLYKAAWNKHEPFVHLCGQRYVDRPEDVTEVKVYSNQETVTLLVDGTPVETKTGVCIFTFQVPLSGKHTIEAVAGECTDTMSIQKTDQPNLAYSFLQKGEVINWFDKESFKTDCYSIQDKLGDLLDHPEAGKLVQAIMDKVHASRGDVAKSTSHNANLQKMLRGMKFESLLKQAGKA